MTCNRLILCHPLLLLPSIFSSIKVFSNESALGIRWPKYWSFSFSISPSNEYSGLISFRIDWSPCSPRDSQESSPTQQFESIDCLVLSLLYGLNLIHPHMTAGRTIAWTIWMMYLLSWGSNLPLMSLWMLKSHCSKNIRIVSKKGKKLNLLDS